MKKSSNKSYQPNLETSGLICFIKQSLLVKPQIILVKRRYSYAFSSFVKAKYDWNEDDREKNKIILLNLFKSMTALEKNFISQQNFGLIWALLNNINPEINPLNYQHRINYEMLKTIFNSRFITSDGGEFLQNIITESTNISVLTLYECPKGRAKTTDQDILETAIRETMEETTLRNFEIIDSNPICLNFVGTDNNIYKINYFVALYEQKNGLNISFNKKNQYLEIDDIVIQPIEFVATCIPKYKDIVQNAYNRAVEYYKNLNLNLSLI